MTVNEDPRASLLISELCALRKRKPELEESTQAMLDLARSGARGFARDEYRPGHFTASAFALSPSRDELLLIRHRKLNLWLQPGGHIEEGDADFVQAARRELEEETGLSHVEIQESLFDVDVHRIPAVGSSPEHLHHDIRVLFCAKDLKVEAREEVADARWFSLHELVEHRGDLADGVATDESVRRVAKGLLQVLPQAD